MKAFQTTTKNVFSSLRTSPYITPVAGYFRTFGDALKYGEKNNPFKIGEIEYKDGKDWKKQRENNSEYQKHRKMYWYIVGGSSLIGGLWGFSIGLKDNQPAENCISSFFFASAAGAIVGLIHPVLIPVTLPVVAVVYPLYKISDINRNLYNQKKSREYEAERAHAAKETRDVLHSYTKYVESELKKIKEGHNIQTYYNWCVENGHYKHKFGYRE